MLPCRRETSSTRYRSGWGTPVAECRSSQALISPEDQPASYARRSESALNRNTPPAPRDSWSASRRRSWPTSYASGPAATAVRSAWIKIVSSGAGNSSASTGGNGSARLTSTPAKEETAFPLTSPSQPASRQVQLTSRSASSGGCRSRGRCQAAAVAIWSRSGAAPGPASARSCSTVPRSTATPAMSASGPRAWAPARLERANSRSAYAHASATCRQRSGDGPRAHWSYSPVGKRALAPSAATRPAAASALEQEDRVLRAVAQSPGQRQHVPCAQPARPQQPVRCGLEGLHHQIQIGQQFDHGPGRCSVGPARVLRRRGHRRRPGRYGLGGETPAPPQPGHFAGNDHRPRVGRAEQLERQQLVDG